MKIQLLLVSLTLISCTFLEETYTGKAFAPLGSIFLEKEQEKVESAVAPDHFYLETIEHLQEVQAKQMMLISSQYDQDLAAEGDCIILYGECNYKGPSQQYCDKPGEQITFQLPVHSVYIPIGMNLKIKDAVLGNKVNLIYSHECISEGLHIPEPKVREESQNIWFDEIKESEKAVLDSGDLSTPAIKYYDNDGKVISKQEYQKLIEADLEKSHKFYLGITTIDTPVAQSTEQ